MCADERTEHLIEYIDRNIEFVQYCRLEFEECFILLLLSVYPMFTSNEEMAFRFLEMGLDITGPYFENSVLRLVQGSTMKAGVCAPKLLAALLSAGHSANSAENDECQ